MCHANSLFFFGAFLYCGAPCTVYNRKSFDPEHLLRTLAEGGATFTSLVPTHYIMMLGLPAAVRARYNVDAVTKLMISSAPARRDTKLAIMDHFRSSGLFELYGSTEAGWVTMLHPGEQLSKLGSVGHECVGSRRIRLLDADGNDVPEGQTGELYSSNGYTFDGYWGMPEKTREAFRGRNCTVGDLISGGENVYPSEVEAAWSEPLCGIRTTPRSPALSVRTESAWNAHRTCKEHCGERSQTLLHWSMSSLRSLSSPPTPRRGLASFPTSRLSRPGITRSAGAGACSTESMSGAGAGRPTISRPCGRPSAGRVAGRWRRLLPPDGAGTGRASEPGRT
jgi:hypothetical protein